MNKTSAQKDFETKETVTPEVKISDLSRPAIIDLVRDPQFNQKAWKQDKRTQMIMRLLGAPQPTSVASSHTKVKIYTLQKPELESYKQLFLAQEIRNMFEKRDGILAVFGNSNLIFNPLSIMCPLCGSVITLGQMNRCLLPVTENEDNNDHFTRHLIRHHSKRSTGSKCTQEYLGDILLKRACCICV